MFMRSERETTVSLLLYALFETTQDTKDKEKNLIATGRTGFPCREIQKGSRKQNETQEGRKEKQRNQLAGKTKKKEESRISWQENT